MNKFGNEMSVHQAGVFVEKNEREEIEKMKSLLIGGKTQEIQKFFFSKSKGEDFNASKLTQDLINKHLKVLDHKNKAMLKELLRHAPLKGSKPQDIKLFYEQKTNWGLCEEDKQIQQYLDFDEDIDFANMNH